MDLNEVSFEEIELDDMYQMIEGSPVTTLGESINYEQTSFRVDDIDKLPTAPNVVTIYNGEDFETVYYGDTDSNYLIEVERGIEGDAREWDSTSFICRLLTKKDILTIHNNINELKSEIENLQEIILLHNEEIQELK